MFFSFLFCLQVHNQEIQVLDFSPAFDDIVADFGDMIELIVESVKGMKRVEKHLFHEVEGVTIEKISCMTYDEEPVEIAKQRIEKVIRKNMEGPERYEFDCQGVVI